MLLSPICTKDRTRFNLEKLYFEIYGIKSFEYVIDDVGYSRLHNALDRLREAKKQQTPSKSSDLDKIEGVGEAI